MLVKSLGLKLIIVGFIIVYMLSPLQTQVYKLLHHISHELTENSHHDTEIEHHHHTDKHQHDFIEATVKKENHQHSLEKTTLNHSHEWLEFFGNTFKINDNKSQKNNPVTEITLDKHTIPNFASFSSEIIEINTSKRWFYHLNKDSLGLDTTTPPPKFFYT